MENEGLADGAPGGGECPQVENDDEYHTHSQRDGGVDDIDQETHEDTTHKAQQGCVPAEPLKCRPAKDNLHL